MSRLGADVAQLEQIAARMAANAEAIDAVIARAGSLLESAWWEGEDARIFREQWSNGSVQLRQLTSALREAGSLVARSAEQQRMASQ